MSYFTELKRAMTWLGEHPKSIFLGQAVAEKGTGMTASFDEVPRHKLLELPVAEDMQMGMSIGLSLAGDLPISIYPRWNFLLLATNQLVLHLDKLPLYSDYRPKVIIRTAVATPEPLDPGPQHLGDFSIPFRMMLSTVKVVMLGKTGEIFPAYYDAVHDTRSTLLVEYTALYNTED
jgi:pyruvate/2-oxoglutarate/acetoin dehydrogenase E1 component